MSIIMEVIHTIRPATPRRFEQYVARYAETAVPLMERHGFDILGAWKWSTGEVGRDLLLIRFDSMSHYESAVGELLRSLADPQALQGLLELGLGIEEHVRLGTPLGYATAERLHALEADELQRPRQYVLERVQAGTLGVLEAVQAYEEHVELVDGRGRRLATAYLSSTGARGEFTNIWALDAGTGDLSFQTGLPESLDLDALHDAITTAAIDYINPLPYSRLQ